jgi:hypothetical protein
VTDGIIRLTRIFPEISLTYPSSIFILEVQTFWRDGLPILDVLPGKNVHPIWIDTSFENPQIKKKK